jgi:hypothetical protein
VGTRRAAVAAVIAAAVLALTAPAATQDRPLPALEPFLKEVRARLETDASRRFGYSYLETRHRTSIDGKGRRRDESVTVLESYPGLPGEGERWERVVERDGKRVPEEELRKADDDRRKKAERVARTLAAQTPADKARIERERAAARRERAELVNDVFVVYDIAMLGRERLDGHDTIAFSLRPRPDSKPRTRDGRMLKSFRGRAWVSESDFELVQLDVEAINAVSIGLGLLARVHKGTTASFTRRKVNGEAWLPARAEYVVSARVLLLKRLREGGLFEFSNYRKGTVDTSTTIESPAN